MMTAAAAAGAASGANAVAQPPAESASKKVLHFAVGCMAGLFLAQWLVLPLMAWVMGVPQ